MPAKKLSLKDLHGKKLTDKNLVVLEKILREKLESNEDAREKEIEEVNVYYIYLKRENIIETEKYDDTVNLYTLQTRFGIFKFAMEKDDFKNDVNLRIRLEATLEKKRR